MPIYHVTSPQGQRLIDANSKAQAIRHATRTTFTASSVTASEVVKLMQSGIAVEKAEAETTTESPTN